MQFKTVAILGAGAIGSYLIWGLSEKLGENLWVIADGDRKTRLKAEGLTINGKNYKLNVMSPAEANGVDLLFVTVKHGALAPSLNDIAQVCDEHTTVVSLMNGVNSEEVIAEVIGEENIVYSLIKIASERNGSQIKFNPETTVGIIYGEKDGNNSTERIAALQDLFADTGLHSRVTDQVLVEIWSKFAMNISRNLPQAVISVGAGAYNDSEHMDYLCTRLRREVMAVAAAKGIIIDESKVAGSAVKPTARYSTLQDIDAKRRTEIDMFTGALVQMGEQVGVDTPYADCVHHFIKALEEKNEGKFDY